MKSFYLVMVDSDSFHSHRSTCGMISKHLGEIRAKSRSRVEVMDGDASNRSRLTISLGTFTQWAHNGIPARALIDEYEKEKTVRRRRQVKKRLGILDSMKETVKETLRTMKDDAMSGL